MSVFIARAAFEMKRCRNCIPSTMKINAKRGAGKSVNVLFVRVDEKANKCQHGRDGDNLFHGDASFHIYINECGGSMLAVVTNF